MYVLFIDVVFTHTETIILSLCFAEGEQLPALREKLKEEKKSFFRQ